MIKNNEDIIMLKVDRNLIELTRTLTGKRFPLIEAELSNLINIQLEEVLRRYAMENKHSILVGRRLDNGI